MKIPISFVGLVLLTFCIVIAVIVDGTSHDSLANKTEQDGNDHTLYWIEMHNQRRKTISSRVTIQKRNIAIKKGDETVVLEGTVAKSIPLDAPFVFCNKTADYICMHWPNHATLEIEEVKVPRQEQNEAKSGSCFLINWQAEDCRQTTLEDCYNMRGSHWYGGTTVRHHKWPLEQWSCKSMPYVTADSLSDEGHYGSVMERYWLTSKGATVSADWETPLWISINDTGNQQFCLKAQYSGAPYNNFDGSPVFLKYTVCTASNITAAHAVGRFFKTPTGIPDSRMFWSPIWSTWARYKANINQSIVLEFAKEINRHGFSNSQIEIDDNWEDGYGTMRFNKTKFPDPSEMISKLQSENFRVTLWVHPFVNLETYAFWPSSDMFEFVLDPGFKLPALTSWWNAQAAMTVDFSSVKSFTWFSNRLEHLRSDTGVSSFKFDAGEVYWLPAAYKLAYPIRNPCYYTKMYARMAHQLDVKVRHQEVRVGAQTQDLPMFVRILDKDSRWDYNNGIKTIIPHILTFGIIGYPFVLPDMVGGNAYGLLAAKPDRELFIRWMQLNAFLPSFQFSITPWDYDPEVVKIAHEIINLRTHYANKIIVLAKESVRTGAPIIRPLWWIAPNDEAALTVDSQFLLGNDHLVAPVLDKGARSRDIYLPPGTWFDNLQKSNVSGGKWLKDYPAKLEDLPYFTKL